MKPTIYRTCPLDMCGFSTRKVDKCIPYAYNEVDEHSTSAIIDAKEGAFMRAATVFNFLLEATLAGSVMILLMLPVRRFLRCKLTSRLICFAWLLVAARLLLPLSLPNPMINELRPSLSSDTGVRPIADQVRVRTIDAVRDLALSAEAYDGAAGLSEALWEVSYDIRGGRMAGRLLAAYAVAALAVAGWMTWRNARFLLALRRGRVGALEGESLTRYRELCKQRKIRPVPVYWVDPLPGACLVGVFRPYIALPLTLREEDLLPVLTHELCHKKAGDPWWGLVRNACCVIHWFNPLVWLAARLSRGDQEMACDEHVIQPMSDEERIRYANTLALNAARRSRPEMSVLATGMTMKGRHIKRRLRAIVDGRAALRWLCVAALCVACAGTLFAFATAEYLRPLSEPVAPQWSGPAVQRHAVNTPQEAEAYAREIFSSGPWLNVLSPAAGFEALQWQVIDGGELWQVNAWPPLGEAGGMVMVSFDSEGRIWEIEDGAAYGTIYHAKEILPANPSYDVHDAYRARIVDFAHLWSSVVLGESFDTLSVSGDGWFDDERCVLLSYTMAESGHTGSLSIRMSPEMYVFRFTRRESGEVDVERIQASNAAHMASRETLMDRALAGAQSLEADFLPMAELDAETAEQASRAYELLTGTFGHSFADADRFVYAHMEQDGTSFLVFHDAAYPKWNYVMLPAEGARTPFTSTQGAYAGEEGIRFLWYRVEEEGWFERWEAGDRDAFVHSAIDYQYQIPFTDEEKAFIRAGQWSVAETVQGVFEAYYGPETQWSEALLGWRDATLERFKQST